MNSKSEQVNRSETGESVGAQTLKAQQTGVRQIAGAQLPNSQAIVVSARAGAPNAQSQRSYADQGVWLILLALVFLILHFIAIAHFDVHPGDETVLAVIAHVPREIGIALFISAMVIFIVEPRTALRHADMEERVVRRMKAEAEEINKEIRQELLTAVFRQNLGEQAIAQIKERLFQPTLFRKSVKLMYSIKKTTYAGKECIVLDVNMTIVTKNNSSSPLPLKIQFETTSPMIFEALSDIKSIKVGDDEVFERERLERGGGTVRFDAQRELQIAPQSEVATTFVFTRGDHISGSEVYCCRLPTEYCEIVFVDGATDFSLFATALHLDNVGCDGALSVAKSWVLKGLLPGQGLSINWSLAEKVP